MSHCPSHDWDRYCGEEDRAAEEERQWWVNHGDRVLQVVCAMIGSQKYDEWAPDEIVDAAAAFVGLITDEQRDPHE